MVWDYSLTFEWSRFLIGKILDFLSSFEENLVFVCYRVHYYGKFWLITKFQVVNICFLSSASKSVLDAKVFQFEEKKVDMVMWYI